MAEQYSSLPNAFSRVITDLADLMQKEMRLARAELSEKLSITIRAGVWMSVAAVLAILAALLVVQACVLGLSGATGIALHWSSLIVAALLAAGGGAAFAKGKADVPEQLAPDRAINQVTQDIAVAKEQFT
jgi:Putative Actinobacterial Holin-X, holin superfamily III